MNLDKQISNWVCIVVMLVIFPMTVIMTQLASSKRQYAHSQCPVTKKGLVSAQHLPP